MEDERERMELLHSCAICGAPAAMPAEGGLQISVIDQRHRVMGWAIHPACLASVLSPMTRAAFELTFPPG
jgi:hypothetical protein